MMQSSSFIRTMQRFYADSKQLEVSIWIEMNNVTEASPNQCRKPIEAYIDYFVAKNEIKIHMHIQELEHQEYLGPSMFHSTVQVYR